MKSLPALIGPALSGARRLTLKLNNPMGKSRGETENQMRSAIAPGGWEKGIEASVGGTKALKTKIGIERTSAKAGGGTGTAALKIASGEWSPLQQMCLEPGLSGLAGEDSWHPKPPGSSIWTVADAGDPMVQATWNKSAPITANTATLIDR
jgi:hypothetical protein